MKNFKLFEKLWEHGRTLRRVGLVLVMCLIAIPQMWAGGNCGFYGNNTYIRLWVNDKTSVWLNCNGDGVSDLELGDVDALYLAEIRSIVWKSKLGYGNVCKVIMHYGINTSRDGLEGSTYDVGYNNSGYDDWWGSSGDDTNKHGQQFKSEPDSWNLLSGLTPGTEYYLDFMFSLEGSDSNDHDCEPDKDKRNNNGGNYHVHFRVADTKSEFTKGNYLYFDARNLSNWKAKAFDTRFYFKAHYNPFADSTDLTCTKTNALEDWVYYVTVPQKNDLGRVQLNRVRPEGDDDENYLWNTANVSVASARSDASQNCLTGSGAHWSGWDPSWTTYCPPKATSTISDNGTVKVWGGSGTSVSPYLIAAGSTIKVSASSTNYIEDANMTTKYDFQVRNTSGTQQAHSDGTATTYEFTSPSTNNTIRKVRVNSYNYYNSTSSTANWSDGTELYYTTKTPYNIAYEKGTYGTGDNVTDVKLNGVAITLRGVTYTRTGYTQTGWCTNSNGSGGSHYNLSASYTNNNALTIYPEWTAKTTTVTLNPNTENHGTGSNVNVTATYDSSLPLFVAAVPEEDYYLTGYYTDKTGGTKVINADGTFAANSGIWNREDGATLTLYAQYEEIDYCYEFAPSLTSGSLSANDVIVTSTGGIMEFTPSGSTSLSYESAGLLFGSNTSCIITVALANNMTAGTIIKATFTNGDNTSSGRGVRLCTMSNTTAIGDWAWSPAAKNETKTFTYVVTGSGTFDGTNLFRLIRKNDVYLTSLKVGNCGSAATKYNVGHTLNDVKKSSGLVGNSVAVAGANYTAVFAADDGYELPESVSVSIGNSAKTQGTHFFWNQSTGTLVIPGAQVTGNIAITITGVEEAATTYSVTAATSTGDDTYGSVDAGVSELEEGGTTTITASPETGYQVTAWEVSGTGASIDDDGSTHNNTTTLTMGTADATVTVTFGAIDYTLSYTLNGGSVASANPSSYTIESSAITLNNPTKDGYTFAGWTGTGLADATTSVTIAAGSTGNRSYTATWTCTTPTIGTNPSDATVCKDATKPALTVAASANGGTLSYQWYSNTTKSTSDATLLTDSTKAKMYAPTGTAGTKYYYCVVTNTTGTCSTTATSSIATVTVKTPVSISSDPSDVDNAVVNSASSLSVTATGSGTLTYQWQTCDKSNASGTNTDITSGSAYSNYNTATLSFTPGSVGTYYFRCKVTDDCDNTVYSNVATVTAKKQPAQNTVSGTASICSGDNTNITLSDSEDGVTYKLYKGGVDQSDDKVGEGDELTWTVSAEGTYTVKAVEDDDYWEREMSGSATVSFKTEVSISTQPTTAVAATESVNFTLGSGMVVAGTGTKSYQWYSYSTSGGADETEIDGAEAATYTTSKAAGTYYYKVKVSADCGTATSNMITVTVTSGPCFVMMSQSDASKDSTISHNDAIIQGRKSCKTLTGGTAKFVSTDGSTSMKVEKGENKGWVFGSDKDQIVITLSPGSYLQEGTTIKVSGYTNSGNMGLKMNGVTIVAKKSSSGAFVDSIYTVKSTDIDLIGKNVLTITRISGTNSSLYSISISDCEYCDPITPTLSYSKTTFWLDEETDSLWCSPTLDKDGSTGTVTYSSSNSDIVWVGSSTGNIYAQGRGVATITASIAADGTHCASEATCKIIVKSIECGTNTIAKATRSTTTASYSGLDGGSALVNNLDGSNYKLKAGGYVGVQLPSSLSFKEGDKIRIDLTIGDWWNGGNVDALPVVVYADNTGTNEIYRTDNYSKNTVQVVEFSVTSSMLTALNASKKVTVYRQSSNPVTQNHVINSVEVKRYTCPDILVFNDEEDDGSWSTADNWLGKAGQGTGLPKDTDRVYIKKSVTVDATTATAGRVHVTNGAVMTVEKNVTMGKIDVETGSTLHVAKDGGSGITLSLKTLHLVGGFGTVNDETKYDMPRVYIDPASTIEKTNDVVNFDIAVNNRSYYPFALPFDVPLVTSGTNAVDYANSYFAYYSNYGLPGGQYAIKTYNGQKRANSGSSSANWEQVSIGTTLKAGTGYALSAMPADASGYNETYAVIRFPMVVDGAWTIEGEQGSVEIDDETVTKNVIPVTAYKKTGTGPGTGDDTPKKNIGWNLLGVPFMSCYQTSADMYSGVGAAAVIQGKIDYETNQWDDKDKVRYVTIPNSDFTEYAQYNIVDDDTKLLPGWCFFVQIETSGNLTFLSAKEAQDSDLPYAAPRREQANMPTLKTGIILSGNDASDKTTILVSDKYSAVEYEINADLEKMFGEDSYTLATYSLSGSTRLAYNAMSNADAANIIPIGYRAPADGEYTFSINPRYAENGAFESVNLIDYETGIVTNLLMSSYTFSTERTQNDARFALNVTKRQDTTTDIENGATDANCPRKVLINDKMYIIIDGKMYDATGKAVK